MPVLAFQPNFVVLLLLKGLAGGALVVVFALIGEVVRPRVAAGLTSAAPSIALASLTVTAATTGTEGALQQSLGMVAGAVALVACCLCAIDTVKRFGALRGSALATVAWLVAAAGLWAVALR